MMFSPENSEELGAYLELVKSLIWDPFYRFLLEIEATTWYTIFYDVIAMASSSLRKGDTILFYYPSHIGHVQSLA